MAPHKQYPGIHKKLRSMECWFDISSDDLTGRRRHAAWVLIRSHPLREHRGRLLSFLLCWFFKGSVMFWCYNFPPFSPRDVILLAFISHFYFSVSGSQQHPGAEGREGHVLQPAVPPAVPLQLPQVPAKDAAELPAPGLGDEDRPQRTAVLHRPQQQSHHLGELKHQAQSNWKWTGVKVLFEIWLKVKRLFFKCIIFFFFRGWPFLFLGNGPLFGDNNREWNKFSWCCSTELLAWKSSTQLYAAAWM